MKVAKEIRIIALNNYIPKDDLLERLAVIAEEKKPLSLILEPNKYDSSCIVAKIGKETIGVVNGDDKRYVTQLLRNGVAFDCLRFLELYNPENETPILRYIALIDLEMVTPIEKGKDWAKWDYSFPVIEKLSGWNTIDYTAGLLERILSEGENDIQRIDDLVSDLTSSTLFDISVETTKAYEDLVFMLEMKDSEQKRIWKHILQRASTERRSKKTHTEKLPDWWNKCLASPESKDLRNTFASMVKEKYNITADVVPLERFQEKWKELEVNLQNLPYGLYEFIDDLGELYHRTFYHNIPRRKLQALMSALILRDWLKKMDKTHDKGGNNYYYIDGNYIHNGDLIQPGGTKIENRKDD